MKREMTIKADLFDMMKADNYYPCLRNGIMDIPKEYNPNEWKFGWRILEDRPEEMILIFEIKDQADRKIADCMASYTVRTGHINWYNNEDDQLSVEMAADVFTLLTYALRAFAAANAIEKVKSRVMPKCRRRQAASVRKTRKKYVKMRQQEQTPYTPVGVVTVSASCVRKGSGAGRHYTMMTWERAGFYRKNGRYVKPVTCHRRCLNLK